jgi:phosphoribosyl-ATP pyrophosphohydrolase/phosphoribosyl-AMP cyclohydrolase/histidinol dehydrogenase
MTERFLVSIDLEKLDTNGSIDFKTVSYLNRVYTVVTPQNLDYVSAFIPAHFNECVFYVDVTALEHDLTAIVWLLNIGATKVFVDWHQLKSIVEERLLDSEGLLRLIVCLEHASCEGDPIDVCFEIARELRAIVGAPCAVGGVYIHDVHEFQLVDAMYRHSSLDGLPARYVSMTFDTWDTYMHAQEINSVAIVQADALTVDPTRRADLLPAELLVTTCLGSDREDGLYSTVVVNEHGYCLGLVFSNEESIRLALKTGRGVYKSRKRVGPWVKGETSGDVQELISIGWDCDKDALIFTVRQLGKGFCHLDRATCFGPYHGLSKLEQTLQRRSLKAPADSYTARLFREPKLLEAKILEEASELVEAKSQTDIAAEAADLVYFALAKCIASGVSLADVEHNLDLKSLKTLERKGDAKEKFAQQVGLFTALPKPSATQTDSRQVERLPGLWAMPYVPGPPPTDPPGQIQMRRYRTSEIVKDKLTEILRRPSQKSTDEVMGIVIPIMDDVFRNGDSAVLRYTTQFDKATSLSSPVLRAPFPPSLMELPEETIAAIDTSFENIRKFHAAQKEEKPLQVETMPGVVCSRFSRPIESVGLYVPGGTAVLPSSAMMLGIPAMVAGCKNIVIASPPRPDGSLTPEIIYIAHKVGAQSIVLAGGAQAIAAMAYGTESVAKVDKILGPGNQFVTAAKMHVANDTSACVSIDMPAGPSEVLVIADKTANPAFVASDLLSQAEHGPDSQVVLIAVDLDTKELKAIEDELHAQAMALPRVDIVRRAIHHSVTLIVKDIEEAMEMSNTYAPEHLILQVENAQDLVTHVQNAGSVFIGRWTPESVGDYSAGVNHSLPTFGYAKQYSGVNLGSFMKHITSSQLTAQGLKNVGPAVMQLAKVEELEAHRRAVSIRLDHLATEEAALR